MPYICHHVTLFDHISNYIASPKCNDACSSREDDEINRHVRCEFGDKKSYREHGVTGSDPGGESIAVSRSVSHEYKQRLNKFRTPRLKLH